MGPRQIREASSSEACFVVEMIESAANEGKFHSDTPSTEEFRRFAFENPSKDYLLLVVQEKNEIVGYIDSRVRRGVGFILGLYVRPAFRNRGIGRALMKKTMEHFTRKACHKARLEGPFRTTMKRLTSIITKALSKKGFFTKTKKRETR